MLEHDVLDENGVVVSTYETEFQELRNKQININSEQYEQLFQASNLYMDEHYPSFTTLQREVKRLDVAFYLHFSSDFLPNGSLGYGTEINNWQIVQ
jgi:hypothetical protein